VDVPFPEPGTAMTSRAEVLLGYLDYFRSRLVSKLYALPAGDLRASRVPSGWTPVELLKHLSQTELRWMEWRFEGCDVADPWGDEQEGRWHVPPGETLEDLVAALHAQAARTRAIVAAHDVRVGSVPGKAQADALNDLITHGGEEDGGHGRTQAAQPLGVGIRG
jgi:hypothetical protein